MDEKKKRDVSKIKFYILVFILILSITASIYFHVKGYEFKEIAKEIAKDIYSYRYFKLVYISLFIISSFFPLPFLTFLGAALFPFYEVLILSLLGNVITFTLMFYLTRWLGRDYVQRYEEKNEKLKKADIELKEHAFRDVMLLRLFFIIPPEAVNIVGGLSKMRFKNYFIASLLGTIPNVLASIMLIKGEMSKNYFLVVLSIIIFVLMLVIPIYYVANLRKFLKDNIKQAHENGKRLIGA